MTLFKSGRCFVPVMVALSMEPAHGSIGKVCRVFTATLSNISSQCGIGCFWLPLLHWPEVYPVPRGTFPPVAKWKRKG